MGYVLRLNPSGSQFGLAHDVDIEDLSSALSEALTDGSSVRVRYVMHDMPDISGELFINGAALESAELVEFPDDAMPPTRGFRTTPAVRMEADTAHCGGSDEMDPRAA